MTGERVAGDAHTPGAHTVGRVATYRNDKDDRVTGTSYRTTLGLRSAGNDFTTILDGLGSVAAVVATDGSIAARYTYDPFGGLVSVTEAGLNQPNVIRYASGIFDETTTLVKFGKRFYDPAVGRFTQPDSLNVIGQPDRGNRYAYAADNPANNTDPNGQLSFSLGGCYGFVIGACGSVSYDPWSNVIGVSLGFGITIGKEAWFMIS
jgi:RHS repeat-associated protein